MTNSPGLAAAVEASGRNRPLVGYSLTYRFGVVGMILAIIVGERWARESPTPEDLIPRQPPSYGNVQVTRTDRPSLSQFTNVDGEPLVFSRLRRDGEERTPAPELRLLEGDELTVIGRAAAIAGVTRILGRIAETDLPLDRRQVDFRRMVLSNPLYAGATVANLDLGRFHAVAAYVRRGDVEMVAAPKLLLELGDRIRVLAHRERLDDVSRELGDSERDRNWRAHWNHRWA